MINFILSLLPKKVQEEINTYRLGRVLVKNKNSYLVSTGYVYSRIRKEFKDDKGDFVPWMNYPLLAFLKERIKKEHKVLEYGSGASTLFFAKEADSVVSIEYDEKWYLKVQNSLKETGYENVDLHFAPIEKGYTTLQNFTRENEVFEIVVIDGRKRVETAKKSLKVLAKDGVIILDDSERIRYKEIFDFYQVQGFSRLTFEGIKPGGFENSKSTIFYRRNNNCFNI